jgi:hypothetical protein
MRDEMFGRMWEQGHDRFSADLDQRVESGVAGLRRRLRQVSDPALHGLLMVAAVAASLGTLMIASPAGASAATVCTAMVS